MHTACVIALSRRSGQFQQPVDGLGLIAGGFCHTLGSTPCGSRQENLHLFRFEIPDNSIDGGGLSSTRAAGDDQKATVDCLHHRLRLQRIQLDIF